MHDFILALDPSGAFMEGKGTTGWCLMDARVNQIVFTGYISAVQYDSDVAYWDAHLDLIADLRTHYNVALLVEDYLLYAHKADEQINSRFETSQLLGVIKHYAYLQEIPIYMQRAAEVKTRWNNTVLLHKGILKQRNRRMYLTSNGEAVCKHELDAIRHAMHYCTFYNK